MYSSDDQEEEDIDETEETLNNNFIDFTEYLDKYKDPKLSEDSDLQFGKYGTVYIQKFENIANKEFKRLDFKEIKGFLREVEITYRTSHPCTLTLVSFNLFKKQSDKVKFATPNIITQLCSKGNLLQLLSPKRLAKNVRSNQFNFLKNKKNGEDGTRCTLIIYGIARGLRYLHNLKINHRDLKPDNIFLDNKYRPHLGDFGQSKQNVDADVSVGGGVGAPLYSEPILDPSPQSQTNPLVGMGKTKVPTEYTYLNDIYSLALILYELYEGHLYPYGYFADQKKYQIKIKDEKITTNLGSNRCKYVMTNIKKYEMPPFKATPKCAQILIEKMWNKDKSKRPNMNYICLELEKSEYWFKNTDPKKFFKYKQMIDQFEIKHFPKFRGIKYLYLDEYNDIISLLGKEYLEKDEKWRKMKIHNELLLLSKSLNFNASGCIALMHLTGYCGLPKDIVFSYKLLKNLLSLGDINAYSIHLALINEVVKYEKQIKNDSIFIIKKYQKNANNNSKKDIKNKGKELNESKPKNKSEFESRIKTDDNSNNNKGNHTKETNQETNKNDKKEFESEVNKNDQKEIKSSSKKKDEAVSKKESNVKSIINKAGDIKSQQEELNIEDEDYFLEEKEYEEETKSSDNFENESNEIIPNEEEDADDEELSENEKDVKTFDNYAGIDQSKLKSPKGQLLMGMIGESLGFNNEALQLYMKSASQGLREAKGRIGSLIYKRNSDYKLAEQMLISATGWNKETKSCKMNPFDAMNLFNDTFMNSNDECNISLFNLGLLNFFELKRIEEARNIFCYLYKSKFPDAPFMIAMTYQAEKNYPDAAKWYKVAADEFAIDEAQKIFDKINEILNTEDSND